MFFYCISCCFIKSVFEISIFAITFVSYLINFYNKMMLNMYKNITGQDKTEFVYVPVYKFKTFSF